MPIRFEGNPPYHLPVVQSIEAVAEGEIVQLVVQVWLTGKSPALASIRAQITAADAKSLADQMSEAAATASEKTLARKRGSRARVKEILMQDWDPIGLSGVGPSDEYDTYAAKAHVMLTEERATVEDIAAYLLHIATEHMGLTDHAEQAERSGRAAEALVSLRRTFEMHDMDGNCRNE
jgi:hypothetical protein